MSDEKFLLIIHTDSKDKIIQCFDGGLNEKNYTDFI